MKDRLQKVLAVLRYQKKVKNQTDFGTQLGYAKAYFSQVMTGAQPLTDKIATEIETKFRINRNWLLTGEGGEEPEFLSEIPITRPTPNAFPLGPIDDEVTDITKSGNEFIDIGGGRYVMLVPKVHEYAYGGYLLGYRDPEYIGTLPKHPIIVNEKHRGKYMAFEMRGESMNNGERDSIEEKDILVGREIAKHLWKGKLHIHRTMSKKFKQRSTAHISSAIFPAIRQGISCQLVPG